jgi:hypothetical protein
LNVENLSCPYLTQGPDFERLCEKFQGKNAFKSHQLSN